MRLMSLLLFVVNYLQVCGQFQIQYFNYEALFNIYYSANGMDWLWQTNPSSGSIWNFTGYPEVVNDPCIENWQGVICIEGTSQSGDCMNGCFFVQQLLLSGYKLQGTLSPYVGNLTMLSNLTLSTNSIEGSIPAEMAALNLLEYLSLEGNMVKMSVEFCFFFHHFTF